jgi:serine/threonine-protein kinase
MAVEIGQLLDNKYRIVRLLGEGGMGAVYEGENVRIRHRVAIKVLHPNIAADQVARERFEREAQAAGHIGSEHIVEVYDLGELPDGTRYMVMEFLAGQTLSERIHSQQRIEPAVVAPLMLQFLEGLGAAHGAGIIHRDLKPDNVFLQRAKNGRDFVKIVDFGISKFNTGGSLSMTRTGSVVGTPYYMSPEQVRGAKNVDQRSDLYSAGVVLFECVTGRVPFASQTFNELMFEIALGPPPQPEVFVPDLDPQFAAVIRKGMAREPDARYQTAGEFAQAITEWMQGASVPLSSARPPLGSLATTPIPANTPIPGNTPIPANTPLPASNVPGAGLTKSTNSGSVLTAPDASTQKRSGAVLWVGVAVGMVAAGGIGFGVLRASAGGAAKSPAAASAAVSSTIAATQAPAAPPSAPAPALSSAPVVQLAPPELATPSASAPTHSPSPPGSGVAAHRPVGAPPATSSTANTTTIKGRTIRTEL